MKTERRSMTAALQSAADLPPDEALRFLELLPSDRLNTTLLIHAAFGLTRLPAERGRCFNTP